jgi:hypothetical protein
MKSSGSMQELTHKGNRRINIGKTAKERRFELNLKDG